MRIYENAIAPPIQNSQMRQNDVPTSIKEVFTNFSTVREPTRSRCLLVLNTRYQQVETRETVDSLTICYDMNGP